MAAFTTLIIAEYILDFKIQCVFVRIELLGRVHCVYISLDGTFMHKCRIYVIILICGHFPAICSCLCFIFLVYKDFKKKKNATSREAYSDTLTPFIYKSMI